MPPWAYRLFKKNFVCVHPDPTGPGCRFILKCFVLCDVSRSHRIYSRTHGSTHRGSAHPAQWCALYITLLTCSSFRAIQTSLICHSPHFKQHSGGILALGSAPLKLLESFTAASCARVLSHSTPGTDSDSKLPDIAGCCCAPVVCDDGGSSWLSG